MKALKNPTLCRRAVRIGEDLYRCPRTTLRSQAPLCKLCDQFKPRRPSEYGPQVDEWAGGVKAAVYPRKDGHETLVIYSKVWKDLKDIPEAILKNYPKADKILLIRIRG